MVKMVAQHPGLWSSSRYYLPVTRYPIRTNNSVIKATKDAERDGQVVNGIKGRSVLTGVVDLIDDIPIDYMHCSVINCRHSDGFIKKCIFIRI